MSEQQTAVAGEIQRLSRCLSCGGKLKLAPCGEGRLPVASCPVCGLPLTSIEGCAGFPPFAAPQVSREQAWKALAQERGFPEESGDARLIEARLLLVPYWIAARGADGSARSAADLRPIGLPPISPDTGAPRGLDLVARTRSGDRMGRPPEGVTALTATAVQVILGPEGGDPAPALEALSRDPAGAAWRLVCYPVWAFHYALHEKEQHHVVDAVSGRPVGPAHRVRLGRAAAISLAALFGVFLLAAPLLGPLAAVPAWGAALAGMRISLRRDRR